MSKEPAVIVGLIASIVVLVATQVLNSGIVSGSGAVNLLGLVISVTPLIAAAVIRAFVTPAP